MIRRALLLPALALAAYPACAQVPSHAELDACGEKSSQTEMNLCFAGLTVRAEAKVKQDYEALLSRYRGNPQAATALESSQRSWEKFRDDECKLEAVASQGGSVGPMVAADCRIALATDWIRILESKLTCVEGDVSCVAPESK